MEITKEWLEHHAALYEKKAQSACDSADRCLRYVKTAAALRDLLSRREEGANPIAAALAAPLGAAYEAREATLSWKRKADAFEAELRAIREEEARSVVVDGYLEQTYSGVLSFRTCPFPSGMSSGPVTAAIKFRRVEQEKGGAG